MAQRVASSRSRRFLQPEDLHPARPRRAWGQSELFPEGQWQVIRVTLESESWSQSQIQLIHDQLRQGWPLLMARRNVALATGHCPLRSHRGS
ncbi:MAG: hypothetical protein VKI83_07965 [Synechococcaceae cyanobacterium]|nr:hypothetical protein [Synechococcaceae cyanobacterium]